MAPPSPFKSSLLALHLLAATRRAAIAGSTPPEARELILSSTDNRESVVMLDQQLVAQLLKSGLATCPAHRPHPTASHTASSPPQQPPAPCVPGPHTNPPTPQTPPPILLLTRWPASGLPHLGPWGRPASGMGPDVSRWGRVALTHKPVADRLLLHCTATTAHLLLTQLA